MRLFEKPDPHHDGLFIAPLFGFVLGGSLIVEDYWLVGTLLFLGGSLLGYVLYRKINDAL